MSLRSELETEIGSIFRDRWSSTSGRVVPESDDVGLYNDGVDLDGVVLYADLDDSTTLVESQSPQFAAEVYKSFLFCAAKIVKSVDGVITAYDGDRIMAVFLGNSKDANATKAALMLKYAAVHIITPALRAQYPQADYVLRHTVGVDASSLFVARTGVRGANDLVWVGRAANHAAKLTSLPPTFASRITEEVYQSIPSSHKHTKDGRDVWEKVTWTTTGRTTYRSNFWWKF